MNKLTITIISPEIKISKATEIFLNLVNKKETQEDWECISHRVFVKNRLINRIYVFQNIKTNEIHELELINDDYQVIQGRKFDNVIYLGNTLIEAIKRRTLGNLIIL